MIIFQYLYDKVPFSQIEEKEEAVWASSLSCLLYFICDRGKIRRSRLKGLDIRVSIFMTRSLLFLCCQENFYMQLDLMYVGVHTLFVENDLPKILLQIYCCDLVTFNMECMYHI